MVHIMCLANGYSYLTEHSTMPLGWPAVAMDG